MDSHSFTHSLETTLCLLSVAKGRSLHGKHGMSVKRPRPPSPNSPNQCVTALDNADLQSLEKFVEVMYDRSSADTSVNYARLNLFACKQRPYDAIPPSESALKLHSNHAAY